MKQKITIREIAEEAGVSKTAASFYLNGKAKQYNLSDATCERIEKVIKKYGYTPNIHAKAINSGKTLLIGVIVENIKSSFWSDIIAGIEETIEKYKYNMLLTVSRYDTARERELLEFLDKKGVDGYIYAPVAQDTPNIGLVKKIAKIKPLVSIITPIPGLPSVCNDNYEGGRIAAKHLLENGHRKIAYIGRTLKFDTRATGFVDCCNEHNIKVNIYNDVDAFICGSSQNTAVFCSSDYVLMNLYKKTAAAGIKIPDDLSAIGYDNMDFVRFMSPAPATVHQYKAELGIAAGELLMKILHNEKTENNQIRFIPELVYGKSIRGL